MAKSSGGKDAGTNPTKYPETTPPPFGADATSSFMLQTIMAMQQTLGGLSTKIDALQESVKDIGTDVKKHGRWIYAANAVLFLIIAVAGFLAKALWDVVRVKLLSTRSSDRNRARHIPGPHGGPHAADCRRAEGRSPQAETEAEETR